jgi:hypothetical protein
MASWKPSQKYLVKVARFFGETREFRTYRRESYEDAVLPAKDLDRTGYWDSITLLQVDVLTRVRKPAKKKSARRASAAGRTGDLFNKLGNGL